MDQIDYVLLYGVAYEYLLNLFAHLYKIGRAGNCADAGKVHLVPKGCEHGLLLFLVRKAQGKPYEEPVHLRPGQHEGAFPFDRVLRCEHEERLRQRERLIIYCDLAFFHGFKKRRLRPWDGAVYLVRKKDVGEDRAFDKAELPAFLVEYRHACDVRGHQVRCELNAFKAAAEGFGHCLYERGLAASGKIVQKDMPSDKSCHEYKRYLLALSYEDLCGLLFYELCAFLNCHA